MRGSQSAAGPSWPRSAHVSGHGMPASAAAAPSPGFGPMAHTPHLSSTPAPGQHGLGSPPLASSSLALTAASSALAGAAFSSKLLGVALVASADFGTRCLFRYPVPPPPKAAASKAASGGTKARNDMTPLQHSLSFSESQPPSPMLRSDSASAAAGSPASFLNMLNGGPAAAKELPAQGDSGIDSDTEPLAHATAKAGGVRDSAGPSSGAAAPQGGAAEEMYGMSPDDFARLFCPKQALCAQVLDVMVDSLRFVSFPVRLHYQESRVHQRRARGARHKARLAHRHKVNRQGGTRPTSGTDEDAARRRARRAERESRRKADAAGRIDENVADDTMPSDASSDDSAHSTTESDSDADEDAGLAAEDAAAGTASSSDDESDSNEHDLTFFNVVFILAGSTSQALASMYGSVAALLARALLHEQTRAHFVSQQTQLLSTIRDKYLNYVSRTQTNLQQAARAGGGGVGVGGSAVGGAGASALAVADFHALSHLLLNHSLLANHLYQLYYGLIHQEYERFGAGGAGASLLSLGMLGAAPGQIVPDDGAAMGGGASTAHANFGHVPVPQQAGGPRSAASYTQDGVAAVAAAFQKLGMQYATVGQASGSNAAGVARSAAHKLLHMDHSHTQLLINNWFTLHFTLTPPFNTPTYNPHSPPSDLPQLRPYHTILLTVPVHTLLHSLPADCSPLLRTLVRHADPRHSLHALSCSLRIPLTHLFKLVLHLLFWNKCLLLDVVSMDNIYGINPAVCQLGNNCNGGTSGSGGRAKTASVTFAAPAQNGATAPPNSARRASSTRPAGHSGTLSSSSNGTSSSSRRRASSVDHASAAAAPSFIPAPLLYEYSQRFAPATFLSFLTRISTQRTLAEHLQRVAFAPVHYQSTHGSAGPGLPPSTPLSSVQRDLQHEFLEQLLFMLKRQWVRQVHRWIVRIDVSADDDDSDESDEDEEARAGMSHSSSMRSLRSVGSPARSPPPRAQEADDPWLALLDRLTPLYFDGRHSVTEILWQERESGLTLAHLQHLCTLFPTQLFMLQHM